MEITASDLYRVLSSNDKEILSHFNDETYSDKEYFFVALNSDIFSAALDLLNNIESQNIRSVGVDADCRKIIEAYTFLKVLSKNGISDEQLSFFRNQYLLVEYYNMESYLKPIKNNKQKDKFVEKMNGHIDRLCEFYKVSRNVLLNHFAEDPNFFMQTKINEPINLTRLIEKYNVFSEDKWPMYEFFSIMSHPHYFESSELEKSIFDIRDTYIKYILDIIFQYIKSLKLWVIDCKEPNFGELFYQECLKPNRIEINSFEVLFNQIINKTKLIQGNQDRYNVYFLSILKDLVKDILVSETLGYNEECISKFKIFAEFVGVDYLINTSESDLQFVVLKGAYDLSSKLSISGTIDKENGIPDSLKSDLKLLYDKYYKEKYQLNDFDKFVDDFSMNSLYFAMNYRKSYKKIVRKMAKEILPSNNYKNEFLSLFQIANDYAHSGGYCFNSTPGVTEITPHRIVRSVSEYLIIMLVNIEAVYQDKKETVDFATEIKFLRDIISAETNICEEIGKKYEELIAKEE